MRKDRQKFKAFQFMVRPREMLVSLETLVERLNSFAVMRICHGGDGVFKPDDQILFTGVGQLDIWHFVVLEITTYKPPLWWFVSTSRFGPWRPVIWDIRDYKFDQTKKREPGVFAGHGDINRMSIRIPHR